MLVKDMFELCCDLDDVDGLRQEVEWCNKIIWFLMYQVEYSFNVLDIDYGLLQNIFVFEEQVCVWIEEFKNLVEVFEVFIVNVLVGILFICQWVILCYNWKFGEMFGFFENEVIGWLVCMFF